MVCATGKTDVPSEILESGNYAGNKGGKIIQICIFLIFISDFKL